MPAMCIPFYLVFSCSSAYKGHHILLVYVFLRPAVLCLIFNHTMETYRKCPNGEWHFLCFSPCSWSYKVVSVGMFVLLFLWWCDLCRCPCSVGCCHERSGNVDIITFVVDFNIFMLAYMTICLMKNQFNWHMNGLKVKWTEIRRSVLNKELFFLLHFLEFISYEFVCADVFTNFLI